MSRRQEPLFKTDVVVCAVPFASDGMPAGAVMKRGARVRADDPVVAQNPIYFVEGDGDDDEINARIRRREAGLEPL